MRKTKEDTERTRKTIIKQAVKLFLRKGFSNTTLDEIARKANVTRGAIYWHFSDKLDILNELLETEDQNLTKLLNDLLSVNLPPFKKLEKTVKEIVNHFFGNKTFRDFIELTWFKIEYTQFTRLTTTKAELTDQFIKNLVLIIEDARKLGEIKPNVSNIDIALTITNMINGMYRMYFILPEQISTRKDAMRSFNSYLNLIKA